MYRSTLSALLLLGATLLARPAAAQPADGAADRIRYTGTTLSNPNLHDGGLSPVVGVHNIQTMRANRKLPYATNGNGWTYNHQPMLAYWRGKFYMHYLCDPVDEHVPPSMTMLQTSADGYAWSAPEVLFPIYRIPEGFTKDGKVFAKNLTAIMHQRVGFYVSKAGRLLAIGNYGIALTPKDDPNDGNGIGRVVREIREDGSFGPEDPVTREQIASLLWNQQGGQEQEPPRAPFTDLEAVSDWARTAVNWAYQAKMMSGNTDGTFLPQNNATRAEGAAIVMNYAKAFYGLSYGYTLPAPRAVRPNTYNNAAYSLDLETGFLSYLDGPYTRGIDVSAHQKEVDWSRVAATGMDFAMIRAGYRGSTQGGLYTDEYFYRNIQGALDAGLEVGAYFFSQATSRAEAVAEAGYVTALLEDYKDRITMPVVFDWEEQDKEDSRTQGTDGNTVTACALAFCKVIQNAGYTPMLYGSPKKVYTNGILLEHLQDYPFWLAHYTIDTAPTSFRYHYSMWQYSSSGAVDGIEGRVDLNICLSPDWSRWDYTGPD